MVEGGAASNRWIGAATGAGAASHVGAAMASKNRGGRETRKPKASKNKKPAGQTPPPSTAVIDHVSGQPKK